VRSFCYGETDIFVSSGNNQMRKVVIRQKRGRKGEGKGEALIENLNH